MCEVLGLATVDYGQDTVGHEYVSAFEVLSVLIVTFFFLRRYPKYLNISRVFRAVDGCPICSGELPTTNTMRRQNAAEYVTLPISKPHFDGSRKPSGGIFQVPVS